MQHKLPELHSCVIECSKIAVLLSPSDYSSQNMSLLDKFALTNALRLDGEPLFMSISHIVYNLNVVTSHLLKQEGVWSVERESAAAAGEDALDIYLQNEVKAGPKSIYSKVKKTSNEKPHRRESWLTLTVNKGMCKRRRWEETHARCDHTWKSYRLIHPRFR
jgi:hypothetical protein